MSKLVKPKLSPNFTMEDLYKLREYNSLRWLEDPEGRLRDMKENAARAQARIDSIVQARKMGIAQQRCSACC